MKRHLRTLGYGVAVLIAGSFCLSGNDRNSTTASPTKPGINIDAMPEKERMAAYLDISAQSFRNSTSLKFHPNIQVKAIIEDHSTKKDIADGFPNQRMSILLQLPSETGSMITVHRFYFNFSDVGNPVTLKNAYWHWQHPEANKVAPRFRNDLKVISQVAGMFEPDKAAVRERPRDGRCL